LLELENVNAAIAHASRNPRADPSVIPTLKRRAWELGIAYNARTILKQTEAAIIKKARSRPPIDEDATADRLAVTAAMRGASAKVSPEPPPNFGQMSDQELQRYTRENFGF
jgi:hypothetical protein